MHGHWACPAQLQQEKRRVWRELSFDHDAPFEVSEPIDAQTDLYAERLRRALDENLGELNDMETRVLARRFPLDDERGATLGAIGMAVGLSKERVRQIQNGALHKLRVLLNADPILQ